MRWLRPILTGMLALGALVGCGTSTGPSTTGVGADGLRTFSSPTSLNGRPLLCTLGAAIHPLVGTLTGRLGAREPVWLSVDGRDVSVVWPSGFTARFEPAPSLYDDRGKQVARDGDWIELGQVSRDAHVGTYEDPFIASGIMFDGCYQFIP